MFFRPLSDSSRRALCRLAPLAVAAAAGLAGPNAAMADQANGFGVATSASADDPYPFIWARSAYRTLGDASGNLTLAADTPPVLADPCGTYQGTNYFCSAVLGGTQSTDDNLTASHSQATLTTGLLPDSADRLTASAASTANLASATLGVDASTGYRQGALAFASFSDRLHFEIAGAGAGTVTHITVGLTLTGSLSAPSGTASVDNALQLGLAAARASYTTYGAAWGDSFPDTASITQGGWVSHSWASATPGHTQFSGVYALVGSAADLDISYRLAGYAGSHTASALYGGTLQLTLPQQVTYTSASGVFLASAVPEPATGLLWALGLGGVALLARRQHRAAARASLQSAHDRCAAARHCP